MPAEIYSLGTAPPLGEVPRFMYAQTIREDRYGDPRQAYRVERLAVPEIAPDECLVLVMAAGINFNGIWAARGTPRNVVKLHEVEGDGGAFHVGGSDASGIVYRVGRAVEGVAIGDEVVLHGGWWDAGDPFIASGGDPWLSRSAKAWGYETNYGAFAQFTRVKSHQLVPKPVHLSWEAAAAYMLSAATAYRSLHGFAEHRVRANDVVLVWGGAGGVGSLAVQLAALERALPIAVVSSEARAAFCMKIGAKGVINRTEFTHWGMLPHWTDTEAYEAWLKGARAFGRAIWEAVGARRNPRIVVEHPGEQTIPTSCFVCDAGGMVVVCAGTSGYNATLDLRHHWVREKRLQGTQCANLEQIRAVNDLVMERKLDPCLSRTLTFDQIGYAHHLLETNQHPGGNLAALVSAPSPGLGRRDRQ
jgi:crotonyl-CoA carboxylase/reductase